MTTRSDASQPESSPPRGGSAFTFTMFQAPGQPDEQFESQHASLLREFENLTRRFGSAS